MAIRNVNGRNVYVLEPRAPTGKTTSGKSWATLYTDLRWKVWEEIQQNEAQMLKMDLASAKMRREYYDDKIKVLQDQRKQLQAAALKGQGGNTSSANSEALRAAQGLERMARQTAGKTVTKQQVVKDMFGQPVIDPSTGLPKTIPVLQTTEAVGGIDPKARAVYERIIDPYLKGETPEADVDAEVSEIDVQLDKQIEQIDRDLEQLLLQRDTTTRGLDADLLRRTREGFAEQVGVIGEGGGPFGLAPRRRRTMPFVQSDVAERRIESFSKEAQADKLRRDELAAERRALLNRREEARAMGLGMGPEAEDLLRSYEDRIRSIDEELRKPSVLEQVMESPEFTPRESGELLLRDRPQRSFVPEDVVEEPQISRQRAVDRANRRLTAIDRGLEPLIDEVPQFSQMREEVPTQAVQEPTPQPRSTDLDFILGGGVISPEEVEGVRPQDVSAAPIESLDDIQLGGGVVPAVSTERTVELGGGYVYDDMSGTIFGPTGFPVFSKAPQTITTEGQPEPKIVSDSELRDIAQKIRASGGDISVIEGYGTKEVEDSDLEAPVQPQTSTRQRKDKYKFSVISEGTKLARTPKKLQRLAKTNLEDDKRPEHYVIVDKLFETNMGKDNAFKMSYDEISRAFKNEPQKREEAHKYLVARDILNDDISEPLA